jgi:hypothetical protein
VLILDPRLPEKRLPDVKFDKQVGRPVDIQMEDDIAGKDQLIIDPNIDFIRKR